MRPMIRSYIIVCTILSVSGLIEKGSIYSRDYYGDTFSVVAEGNCTEEDCSANGKREAEVLPGIKSLRQCVCQCSPMFGSFRDDTYQCVNEIDGCLHATFLRERSSDKIPFVFLPKRGQILHPSAPLSMPGRKNGSSKVECNVVTTSYLMESGWKLLKEVSKSKISPLIEFVKDGNRLFLQWNGNEDDIKIISTHIVKVHLSCKQHHQKKTIEEFNPCVTFRVAGTAVSPLSREDSQESQESESSGPSNYVIIGLSIGFLGLMYVVAVFIFMSVRKRRIQARKMVALEARMKSIEVNGDGSLKKISDHQYDTLDDLDSEEAIVNSASLAGNWNSHIQNETNGMASAFANNPGHLAENFQEGVPEESVHIEESGPYSKTALWHQDNTTDDKQNSPVPTRTKYKRIYFNPEFFERDMLINPPPAAEEFAKKIQEMINVAKTRLKNKKYIPKLHVVPEDDYFYQDLSEILENDQKHEYTLKEIVQPTVVKQAKPVVKREKPRIAKKPVMRKKAIEKRYDSSVSEKVPDSLEPCRSSPLKLRKLCRPPPPPPPTAEPNNKALNQDSEGSVQPIKGLSQFDLFRQDLELKIKNLNSSRQQSNKKPLQFNVSKPPVSDVNNEEDICKVPITESKKSSVLFNSGKVPKLPQKNILRNGNKFSTDFDNLIQDIQNEKHCFDNNVVKLDLTFSPNEEEVKRGPKTTIHIEGDSGPKSPENSIYSTSISIESPTVICIKDCEEATSTIQIKELYDQVLEALPQPTNEVPLNLKPDTSKGDSVDDNNLSSDSAIDDTSLQSSPADSNSESSEKTALTASKGERKSEIGIHVAGPVPKDPKGINKWLNDSEKLNPVQLWLQKSECSNENYGPNELDSLDSVSSDASSTSSLGKSSCKSLPNSNLTVKGTNLDEPRSLPVHVNDSRLYIPTGKGPKSSPMKPPRKAHPFKMPLKAANNATDVVTAQDWLRNTDDDDDDEIIPVAGTESSQFLPPERMDQPEHAIQECDITINNEDSSSESFEGPVPSITKANNRKIVRRRPVKNRTVDVKKKVKQTRFSDNVDFISDKKRLVAAQETLLNQIAQNLSMSDTSYSTNTNSSVSSNDSDRPRPGRSIDKTKLDALLNGQLNSNETIL